MAMYNVTVNFGGYIGADEVYPVEANSKEEAEELALEYAREDLYVDSVEEEEE